MSQNNNPFVPSDGAEEVSKIVKEFQGVRTLSRDEIIRHMPASDLAYFIEKVGRNNWTVLSPDGLSVAYDPAMKRPMIHNNKKFAEMVAKEIGGVAITVQEAIKVLTDKARSQ